MGDLFNGLRPAFYPGHRIPRVDGMDGLKKFPMARDCEGFLRDTDDNSPYIYYKSVDVNGAEIIRRYHADLDMPEEFDPDKYVTKQDLNSFKEEIVDAVVSKLAAKFPATNQTAESLYAKSAGSAQPSGPAG